MYKGKDISNCVLTLAEISLTFSAGRQVYFKGRQNLTELKADKDGLTAGQFAQCFIYSKINLLSQETMRPFSLDSVQTQFTVNKVILP